MRNLFAIDGTPIDPDALEWGQYRKRPVVIAAVQMPVPFFVQTMEGLMEGRSGDWLIQGVEGELYPCADSVFQKTYGEAVDGEGNSG